MTDQTEGTADAVPPQPEAVPAPEAVTLADPVPAPVPAPAPETVPAAVEPDAWALSPEAAQEELARRPRRGIKLRWMAALLVLMLTGAAATVAVTRMERNSLPGLETPNDGRYVFPVLTLPPLPSGKPSPGATEAKHRHHADLRQLVLPAPSGAVASPAPSPSASATTSPGAGPAPVLADWRPCYDFAQLDQDPAKAQMLLDETACRAATRSVWTAADGTRTEIWLLRFGSADESGAFYLKANTSDLKEPAELEYGKLNADGALERSSSAKYTKRTAGADHEPVGRVLRLQSGDVTGLIVMTNENGVPLQAFRQVAMLQSSLLN